MIDDSISGQLMVFLELCDLCKGNRSEFAVGDEGVASASEHSLEDGDEVVACVVELDGSHIGLIDDEIIFPPVPSDSPYI